MNVNQLLLESAVENFRVTKKYKSFAQLWHRHIYHAQALKITNAIYERIDNVRSFFKYFTYRIHFSDSQNWLLYICSSMVLPPLLVLQEEQTDSKMSDTEPLLSPDTTPVHAPSPTCLVTATTNGGELLELRLDSISTISS